MVNVKVSILGAGGVGKTSIRKMFCEELFETNYKATIGSDFSIKDYRYSQGKESINIRYMLYDLAGQSRYKSGRANFIIGSHAGILVYDISNRKSFDDISEWLTEFKSIIKEPVPLVLVANKIDLRATSLEHYGNSLITTEEGKKLAENLQYKIGYKETNKFYFIEVSALENIHVSNVFEFISQKIYEMYLENSFHEAD